MNNEKSESHNHKPTENENSKIRFSTVCMSQM
jgi:hypothetical protein